MADVTVTDSNYASAVKSSYDDVNNALENLLGNVGSGSYASKSDIDNLQNQLNNFVGTNPVGTILPFGTSTVPNGYLLCNGASFDTAKYATLYSAIKSSSVPDMRGMFLRGLDTSGSADREGPTRVLLSFQEGTRHFLDNVGGNSVVYASADTPGVNSMKTLGLDPVANSYENHAVWYTQQTGLLTANDVPAQVNNQTGYNNTGAWDVVSIARPKNVAVNYIIKAVP